MTHSDDAKAVRCFDIGGTKIVAADVLASGEIDELGRVDTPINDFDKFCQSLALLCAADSAPISISIAGVIHPTTNKVNSANVPCISGRALTYELSAYLERPVYLINDANAFALAEARLAQAKGHDVVMAVILGTGIGGGIVVNGHILSGADGTAGEWGHGAASAIRTGVELPKIACNCGQLACVDTLGGARGLERLYSHFASSLPGARKASGMADSHSIIMAWLNEEALAVHVIDVWLDVVGSALAAAVNLLGTSIVAVGGGLANSKPLIESLDKEVRDRCLASFPAPLLYSAVSGPEQGLAGAAIHARSQLP
jgi:N-acetylglucosamine kinase